MDRINEIAARAVEIEAELSELASAEALTDEQAQRFDTLVAEVDELAEERAGIERRQAAVARTAELAQNPANVERGVPNFNRGTIASADVDPMRATRSEARDAALRLTERLEADHVDDNVRGQLEQAIKGRSVKDERGAVAGLVLTTSNDAYRSAFQKGLAGAQNLWTNEEREAVLRAQEWRAALGLADANGGYGVPTHLDPTLILTNDGSNGAVRGLARVERITTNQWNGLSSAGVTAGFAAEMTEVGDNSPTFGAPQVNAHKAQAFVQGSIEIVQDFRGLEGEVMMMFADAKDRLEAVKFVNGAGDASNEPYGIITALDGGAQEVAPTTVEVFADEDILKTKNAIAARWRSSAVWVANPGTIDAIRAFGSADWNYLVDLGAGQPRQLLGYALYDDDAMDDSNDINAGATADNHILLFGDFRNYLIAERVGMAVEFVPHLFNTANNLPDGRRGWYAYWRVGADSINDKGFVVLNVATTL